MMGSHQKPRALLLGQLDQYVMHQAHVHAAVAYIHEPGVHPAQFDIHVFIIL